MGSPQCPTARGSSTQPGPELWVHHSTLHHVAVVLSPDQNYGFTTVPLHHVAVELSPDQNYGFTTVPLQHVVVGINPVPLQHVAVGINPGPELWARCITSAVGKVCILPGIYSLQNNYWDAWPEWPGTAFDGRDTECIHSSRITTRHN